MTRFTFYWSPEGRLLDTIDAPAYKGEGGARELFMRAHPAIPMGEVYHGVSQVPDDEHRKGARSKIMTKPRTNIMTDVFVYGIDGIEPIKTSPGVRLAGLTLFFQDLDPRETIARIRLALDASLSGRDMAHETAWQLWYGPEATNV